MNIPKASNEVVVGGTHMYRITIWLNPNLHDDTSYGHIKNGHWLELERSRARDKGMKAEVITNSDTGEMALFCNQFVSAT